LALVTFFFSPLVELILPRADKPIYRIFLHHRSFFYAAHSFKTL